MNGARSTYMRKGYLLTALAAAVLLAASSGTAWAQSVEFDVTTAEVLEGSAGTAGTDPPALRVTVTRSPRPTPPTPDDVGAISVATNPDAAGLTTMGVGIMQVPTPGFGEPVALDGGVIAFNPSSNQAVLVITKAEDDDWDSESITLSLRADAGTSIGPDLTLTMVENEAQPIASFNVNPVLVHEGTAERVVLFIDVPKGTSTAARPTTALTALSEAGDNLVLSVSPVGAIGLTAAACAARNSPNVVAYTDGPVTDTNGGVALHRDGLSTTLNINEMFVPLSTPGAKITDVDPLVLNACPDTKGIKDKSITLTVIGTTDSGRRGLTIRDDAGVLVGTIGTASPLVINIDSDEAVPTLSFSPTDVTIDEGESVSTRLIAEGKFGAEVGMVKLSVEGDAMVSLMHDGEMLEEMDGYVYVDLGSSNTAALTAMSHSDPDLMDGYEKFKAWKLMEGGTDGANIGDDYWFKVVVMGSTAVPALPLLGQLLLALFLMAGGARLYRRRQG